MNRIVVVSSCLIALTALAGACWGQIVVNEIMADPASDWDGDSTYSYKGDEWIEIYNAGVESVDLAAYWVGDSDSTLLYNFSGTLRARKHVVVYGSQVESWQRANGLWAMSTSCSAHNSDRRGACRLTATILCPPWRMMRQSSTTRLS